MIHHFITGDNLELYFTRYPKGTLTPTTTFEICVSIREKATEGFSVPQVLFTAVIEALIEAPTLTADKKIMYYHKKYDDTHKIMMRYRN